ncbi:MAG: cation-transporting P-type ATPase, partial [Chloroflexi bacterium]|nr:cation-transporting P-type ATPase [Chloroflexota bacterium]
MSRNHDETPEPEIKRERRRPPARGLTSQEAAARRAIYGPNLLVPEQRRPSFLTWILRPFADPMVILLLVAGTTYLLLGDRVDAAIIVIAIAPLVLVTLALETRAERALEQLRHLAAPTAVIWRDGEPRRLPAEEIVPGDIVVVQEGDTIPADGILIEGAQITVDESALTGESQPVTKDPQGRPEAREVFAGTTVLSGRGICQITSTGQRTRYGQIGTLVAGIRQQPTPLQRLIRRLVWQLAGAAIALCTAVAVFELFRTGRWERAVITGISLAIAAIPEEFPVVYTLYLTLGAWRLAREHALIRRLASVETLGATTVICTDKTGTLTLGRLEVTAIGLPSGVIAPTNQPLNTSARAILIAAILASEIDPFDPLEQAIITCAARQGIDVRQIQRGRLVRDYPFDPVLKYMSHVWQTDSAIRVYAKGAPEGILERSRTPAIERRRVLQTNEELATRGLRVIAVATGVLPAATGNREADESSLVFRGLIAFSDPPREGVAQALRACQRAGIRVIMITGDHPVTAHAIAEGLGLSHGEARPIATGTEIDAASDRQLAEMLSQISIFARIRPDQKYRIVRTLRAQGEIVAMTGDGINDAPALREADIGIAMGQRGTEVARESSDMILLDDNFATIVTAVYEGRRIFENLRHAFAYIIAFHTPLLAGALVIPLLGIPFLFLPVTLVWLEIIMHPIVSLVFENDPPPPDLMDRPPRPPGVGLLVPSDFIYAFVEGITLFAGSAILYLSSFTEGDTENHARAVALTALFLGQMLLAVSIRVPAQPFWTLDLRSNRVLLPVLGAAFLALLTVLYVQPVSLPAKMAPLTVSDWALAAAVAAAST